MRPCCWGATALHSSARGKEPSGRGVAWWWALDLNAVKNHSKALWSAMPSSTTLPFFGRRSRRPFSCCSYVPNFILSHPKNPYRTCASGVRRRAAETPPAAMEGTSAKTGLLNELLANNSSYASGFNKPMSLGVHKKVCVWLLVPGSSYKPPLICAAAAAVCVPLCLQLSVITCMDSRLMVASMLGLDIGDIGERGGERGPSRTHKQQEAWLVTADRAVLYCVLLCLCGVQR